MGSKTAILFQEKSHLLFPGKIWKQNNQWPSDPWKSETPWYYTSRYLEISSTRRTPNCLTFKYICGKWLILAYFRTLKKSCGDSKRPCFDQLNAHTRKLSKMCAISWSKHGHSQSPLAQTIFLYACQGAILEIFGLLHHEN